jgi:hypothetical protein
MVTRDPRVTLVRRDRREKLAHRVRKARSGSRGLSDRPVLTVPPDLMAQAARMVNRAILARMVEQDRRATRDR